MRTPGCGPSGGEFKILKYCPALPDRFGSISDAKAFCVTFFHDYNHERQSGIGLHAAVSVHYGAAAESRAQRAHPGRGLRHEPDPVHPEAPTAQAPTVAWINEPFEEVAQGA